MPHGGTIIDFPGQEADEQIFIFTRRHPLAFLPTLVIILLMLVLGLILISFLGLGNILTYNQQLFVGSAYLLFVLLFTLIEFFDFYFDLYIVTDRRVVDIDQQKLFSRSISELILDDIQDVDALTRGILATFFDFGTVMIQTAGAKPNFEFQQIPHPKEVAAMILDLSDQARQGASITSRHPEGPIAAMIDGRLLPHTDDHLDEIPPNL